MPNWCENYLEIRHDDSKYIEKVLDFVKGPSPDFLNKRAAQLEEASIQHDLYSDLVPNVAAQINLPEESISLFQFNKIVPIPDELLSSVLLRNWIIENWGTKWEAEIYADEWSMSLMNCTAIIGFDTANGECAPIIHELHKKFEELDIYYETWEGGNEEGSRIVYENGEELEDSTFNNKDQLEYINIDYDNYEEE